MRRMIKDLCFSLHVLLGYSFFLLGLDKWGIDEHLQSLIMDTDTVR